MADRRLLHKSNLAQFKKYMLSIGYKELKPTNCWEVFRCTNGNDTAIVYEKAEAKEHLSMMDKDYKHFYNFKHGRKPKIKKNLFDK